MGSKEMIILILGLIATVLAFIYIVPERRKERLNLFGSFLHYAWNFKYLIIEKVLQALYIFSTVVVVLYGCTMLFDFDIVYRYAYRSGRSYGYGPTRGAWTGYYGLIVMILGPIVVRIAYELLMMLILLVKNVMQINNKMALAEESEAEPSAVSVQPRKTAQCPACGKETPVEEAGKFCIYCGKEIENHK